MKRCKVLLLGLITILTGYNASAQHTPLNPISSRVFTPFIINPAIAGSKDFMALDLTAAIQGSEMSQLLSGNGRIAKKGPRYFGAPVAKSFTSFGVGASLFNDMTETSRNIGLSTAASYHIPLNDKNVSFVSGGLAIKGVYNMMDSIPDTGAPQKNQFIPNVDAGIYFYGQSDLRRFFCHKYSGKHGRQCRYGRL